VSPLGNYLAIEGSRYEGDFFRALDCQTSELLIFDKQYTEFVKILVWSPDGNSAYAKAHDYLVKYDMIMKQAEMLTSPNIRDYLTEAYLLEQGYVGDRIDMRALLGTDRIKFINWAPDGWSFVYQSWGEVGCLYSFDLRDMTNELILDLHSPYEWFKQFDIVWDRDLEPHADIPAFSNDDEIVSFDESILSSYLPLNDSAAYQIGRRYSISFLLPYWHGSASDRIKNLYFFRDQINEEKFHVAELDFLFWYFAFCQTPEYWFLLSRYGSCPEMTIDSLIAEFSTFNSDYYQDYLYFIGINYPDVLKHRKQEYNRLVYRDYRFQETFLHYLSNNDFNILKDSVLNIFRGEDTALIESCLDTLQYSPQEERKRQIKFYMLIHNNFSNYYGRVICPDLEQTKDNLLIEELMDDWFYKFASLYDDKYISVDYFRWKVLSLPHQSKSI